MIDTDIAFTAIPIRLAIRDWLVFMRVLAAIVVCLTLSACSLFGRGQIPAGDAHAMLRHARKRT